jgi:Flp pilus assembly protein TadG
MTTSAKPIPESGTSRALRRRLRGERGVAAVEFALVLPMFLTLTLGMIDYGYYLYLDMCCVNAAREASRRGVVASTTALAQTDAVAAGNVFLKAAGLDLSGSIHRHALHVHSDRGVSAEQPVAGEDLRDEHDALGVGAVDGSTQSRVLP